MNIIIYGYTNEYGTPQKYYYTTSIFSYVALSLSLPLSLHTLQYYHYYGYYCHYFMYINNNIRYI